NLTALVCGMDITSNPLVITTVPAIGCQLIGGLKLIADCKLNEPPGQLCGQLILILPFEPLADMIGPNDCTSSMKESNCAVTTPPLLNPPSSMPTCIGRPAKAFTANFWPAGPGRHGSAAFALW